MGSSLVIAVMLAVAATGELKHLPVSWPQATLPVVADCVAEYYPPWQGDTKHRAHGDPTES